MKMQNQTQICSVNILPVTPPLVTTYTHHAHFLSILSNYKCTYEWIMENYIQLYMYRDNYIPWGDFYFPATHEVRPFDTCKWISSQKIHRDLAVSKWGSIIDFIIEQINSNDYIHTMVNYYYVPLCDIYGKYHFCHDIFIHGYDMNKKILYVSDFFKGGKYSREEISFSDFSLAFSMYNCAGNDDYLFGKINLYKFNNEYTNKYRFSFSAVINSIKKYLLGDCLEYWSIYDYENNKNNTAFGIEVYSSIINYIKKTANNGTDIDIRPLYLVYDHKSIMAARLKYLYKQGYLDNFNYDNIERFTEIISKTRTVVNIIIKYNITKDKILIDRVVNTLNDVKKEEIEILSQLL